MPVPEGHGKEAMRVDPQAPSALTVTRLPELLILSGRSESALDRATADLREFLDAGEPPALADVARTLQAQSRALPCRRALVCADRLDAVAALAEEGSKRILSTRVEGALRPVVFLLPGVGDQYVGMGHGLYSRWPAFRTEVDRCAQILEAHLGVDIREVLYPAGESWKKTKAAKGIDLRRMLARSADAPDDPAASRLNRTRFAQPALFTIEYAAARLLQSLGINPDAMVGHSMGEYVAACLAGVFSLEDALKLIAVRAALVDDLPQGAMLSVLLSEEELLPLMEPGLSISLINGPNNCVVAGGSALIDTFEKRLNEREVVSRRVQNGHAFHTRALDPILGEFRAAADKVRFQMPKIPYSSNVMGDWVMGDAAGGAAYWAAHATQTARFNDILARVWQLENPILVECGPGRTLTALAAQHPARKVSRLGAISSLRHHYENEADHDVLLRAIGKIWLSGRAIDWQKIPRDEEAKLVALPAQFLDGDECSLVEGPGGSLAAPQPQQDLEPASTYVPPRNDLEISLTEVCERVLGLERVGITDNFFELGGHSLAVIKLVMEMKQATGLDINLGEVFRTPTIADLVSGLGSDAKKSASIVVPLQPKGEAIPVFCLCGIDIYREFARSVGVNQPVCGVYVDEERAIIEEVLDGRTSGVSIDRLVEAYDSAISRFQPQGPYRLAGLSFGGMLAVELASKLRKRGETVDLVFLFDTLLPEGKRRLWGSWLLRQWKEISGSQRDRKLRQVYNKLRSRIIGRSGAPYVRGENHAFYQEFKGKQRAAFLEAEKTWRVRSEIDFPVILFRASEHDMWGQDLAFAEDYGWGRYVGERLRIVPVTGGHRSLIEAPNVAEVGRLAARFLREAGVRSS
jgi:malonyl CoA-acyl carrier protein transacylase/thioesterase domain-containing protein/acyl carrier protein